MDAHQIQEEWEAALEDAGLATDERVLLLTDRSPADEGRGAQWWQPGMTIEADEHLVTEELAERANALEHRDGHRMIVRRPLASDPISVARFSGKLRHELEHARQWQACGQPVFQLSVLADWVLAAKITGLPHGRTFTNLKPIEQDANAASAMFLRKRWPDAVEALLNDLEDAPLVRSLTPPASPYTLVTRMVSFLYVYEDLCADLEATWAISFAQHLDEIAPGAGTLWQTLEKFGPRPATGEPHREPPADTRWEEG